MDLLNNKNRLKKEGYDEQKSGPPYKRGRKCFFAADSCISADSLSSFPFRDGFGTLPVKAGCRCFIGPFPSATLYEYVHILYSSNGKKSISLRGASFSLRSLRRLRLHPSELLPPRYGFFRERCPTASDRHSF